LKNWRWRSACHEKRLITSEDIDRFADLSGDHFYVHIKTTGVITSLNDRWRMAILSSAQQLFVCRQL
jgi:oxepin-CoA hydrolase/3-oxo-5,6-dehydrosuberyl-CoA semialdehyde dehydrogenase